MTRLGWEEIRVKFYVAPYDFTSIDKGTGWELLLRNADREGGGGHVIQRWDHEPNDEEVKDATLAAKRGIGFITTHLACAEPQRRVEVVMPRIRLIIDVDEDQ
jgi:hypothetical protein